MAVRDIKILTQKIGVSLAVFLVPLSILSGGILLIQHFLSN